MMKLTPIKIALLLTFFVWDAASCHHHNRCLWALYWRIVLGGHIANFNICRSNIKMRPVGMEQ